MRIRALSEISLELLRVFHHVAQLGSMTTAAKALFITQPAVSHAISQLEEQLDCRLFERVSRRLVLTAEGQALIETTQKMFEVLRLGSSQLTDIRAQKAGLIRIGCPLLVMQTCLTEQLSQFHAKRPDVQIRMEIENRMQNMLDLLRNNQVDLLFLATPEFGPIEPGFSEETIGKFDYSILASRAHYPNLEDHTVTLEEINRHDIVVLRSGNNSRDYIERLFLSRGLQLNVRWETKTMAMTHEFVRAGFGLGVIVQPRSPLEPIEIPGTFELRTDTQLPRGRYVVLYRSDRVLAGAAASFLELVRKNLEKNLEVPNSILA